MQSDDWSGASIIQAKVPEIACKQPDAGKRQERRQDPTYTLILNFQSPEL